MKLPKQLKNRRIKFIANNLHWIILIIAIISYVSFFSLYQINEMNLFHYSAFDIGISDQAVWLLSEGKDPFVTVRGVNIFGDHIQFNYLLFAPFYWVWKDIRMLLILQSLFLGLGALPLYLIARNKLKGKLGLIKEKFIPLVFVFSYLLYPALHYLNLENFHPISMGVPFLFFAFYFLDKKHYKPFFIFLALTLITREEYVMTAMFMGIYVLLKKKYYSTKLDRKIGIAIIIIAIIWLIIAMKFIMPMFNDIGYYQSSRASLSEFGKDPIDAMINMVINPIKVISKVATPVNGQYFFDIFAPTGFLSFLNPLSLLLAFPAVFINMVTSWHYSHYIEYHYTSAIIPFIFISLVASFAWLTEKKHKEKLMLIFLTILIFSTILGSVFIGHRDTKIDSFNIPFREYHAQEITRYKAVSIIPDNASVSAVYLMVPQFTHREIIYMFPNPFIESYWGLEMGNFTPETPTQDVDYIVLDQTPSKDELNLITFLEANTIYYEIFNENSVRILKRNQSVPYSRNILPTS